MPSPVGRLDLGPVDGRRLHAHRSAGLRRSASIPGPNPPTRRSPKSISRRKATCGSRGIDIDQRRRACGSPLASGHIASFDRRKCKGPLNGPKAATGKHLPRGLDALPHARPAVQGRRREGQRQPRLLLCGSTASTRSGSARTCRSRSANGSESLLAVVDGKMVDIRVPYPLGFFTKNVDGRIDDPNAGWKGRGLWTTIGHRTPWLIEGGKAVPKPLAASTIPGCGPIRSRTDALLISRAPLRPAVRRRVPLRDLP